MEEVWELIKYNQNYKVSNFGNIKNIKTNKLISINYDRLRKTNTRARPYLSKNSKATGYYLHRIVAEHFIDNPNNLPEVNHIDGDCYNNKSVNLEWISKLDNMKHASENKLIKRYTRKIIIINKESGEEKIFDSLTNCAKYLDCNTGKIYRLCNDKYKDTHKIYDIKYEKENNIINEENIIWKEYPECKKYLVSSTGEIKNKKTGRIMMGSKQNGYRFVTLFIDKITPKLNRLIHRMVAQTFLQNLNNKPVVNHKDTNILNNHIDNLEWVTYKENMNTENTIKNLKKGKNSKVILQIEIDSGSIINKFYSASTAGEKTGIDCSYILRICNYYNENKNYGGTKGTLKTYKKKYIFIFEENKYELEEILKIAKTEYINYRNFVKKSIKTIQINKKTNEIINTFKSGNEASKKLNINNCIINNICNYYKYTDENRPKRLKYYHSYKGFIFKQINQSNQ
tara:strand:- start:67 stop:1431 length:1365 start_codon:yes stop_codon:yes gene_type:complete